MTAQLDRAKAEALLQADDIAELTGDGILRTFREETDLQKYLPDGICRRDPRDGARVIFNSARAKRPHHIRGAPAGEEPDAANCPVCNGNTTGVLDIADLSEGFTFINKNLFPILYPEQAPATVAEHGNAAAPLGGPAAGLHLLQWTSSHHDKDWHNMPAGDRRIVARRLAVLERKLLFESENLLPQCEEWGNPRGERGFVAAIKNYGKLVGGSLAHGHQQIAYSTVMPQAFRNNWLYLQREGRPFSEHMLAENPDTLTVRDYGLALLVVPYFMRRPYNMMLLLKDVSKQYLCDLSDEEIGTLADGLHDATAALLRLMPDIGRDPAYNVTIHNGPGAGLYAEFLPYTQETGGFEHLGLWVCQNHPESVAEQLRGLS